MGLPKKGLRKIEHNGHQYGWYIRKKPTYTQAAFECSMRLAIQELASTSPTILYVTLNISRADNWIVPHKTAVVPSDIVNIIEAAQEDGWQYDAGGVAYEFYYEVNVNS